MQKQNKVGSFVIKKIKGESYKAYIPPMLPLSINLESLYALIEKANIKIKELNIKSKIIPNTSLFTYMYVRKEALLSSQIEGTQSSFSDLMLFEHNQKTNISIDDVEEVSNYVKAINYAIKRLDNGFPMCLRLLKEIHKVLLSGSRGSNKLPGEFRKSQNWIGGTRPGNALFVPPPVEVLSECLSNFEKFLYYENIPILVKSAIAHVQFETIHPFLDGNGRIGRLLIILILYQNDIIDNPILYISLYLKQNRNTYYNLLQEVRIRGNWEVWIEFFLTGIIESSNQAIKTTDDITHLFEKDKTTIEQLGRIKFSCLQIFDYLKHLPQFSVPFIAKELNISQPTARAALNSMVKAGILEEITEKKRDKIYLYKNYLNILEYGTEPI